MSENSPISQSLNNGTIKGLAIGYRMSETPAIAPPGLVSSGALPPTKTSSTSYDSLTSRANETKVWGIKQPLFGINRTVESIPQPICSSFDTEATGSPLTASNRIKAQWEGQQSHNNKISEIFSSRGFEDFPQQENLQPVGKHQFDPSAYFTSFVPRGGAASKPPSEPNSKIAEGIIADDVMEIDQQTSGDVIADLKQQLESLICAVMLTSAKPQEVLDTSVLQGADAIEVSHRIMTRMKMLRDENKRLYKLANGSSLAQMESTIARLEKENASLRKYIKDNH